MRFGRLYPGRSGAVPARVLYLVLTITQEDQMPSLTDQVLSYQRTGRGYRELASEILVRTYRFPSRCRGFDDDDRGNFVLFFYPFVRRVVIRFRDQGAPFESYLNACLRYQLRSYAKSRACSRMRLHASWSPVVAESLHPERVPVEREQLHERVNARRPCLPQRRDHRRPLTRSCALRINGATLPHHNKLSGGEIQRLLIVSLKACEHLEDDAYRRLARLTGCDEGWLTERSAALRGLCAGQRRRRELLRNRRDSAWFAAECTKRQIAASPNPITQRRLAQRVERLLRTVTLARADLRRATSGPTNEQIANMMGLHKGTIDSGIFLARQEATRGTLAERLVESVADAYDEPYATASGNQQRPQAERARCYSLR